MNMLITLIICVLVSFLFTLLAKKLRLSAVIGLIVGGVVLGYPVIKNIVLEPNTGLVLSLADIGLVALMFLAGLEISWREFCEEEKKAAVVSVFAAVTPFLLGFAAFMAMGFSFLTSLTIGISMSITAEATNASMLLELKKLKTRIGSLMMGAGIIDDVMGMALFVLVSYFFTKTFVTEEIVVLLGAILAFFIGISAHKVIGRKTQAISCLEKILLLFLVPFFFIGMGIHFSLQSISMNILLLIVVIAIAIAGKILGTLLTKPFTKLSLRQLYLVGWGMNSRGAVELAIAFTAFRVGLLDTNIYSSMVVMALVTTLVFPFFVKGIIRKYPDIME